MHKLRIIVILIGISPLISFSQTSYTCEAEFLHENGPQWQPYFNEDTLKNQNITRITVHAGPYIQRNQIEKYKKEYRIHRFLVNEGKITESVNFSRKDIYDGNTVGIPEEYQKYVYSGDTLITMYHTWALMHYEERYAFFLSDFSIDDYLSEMSMEFATVSDVHLNKAGKIKYFIQRGENAEILPEGETTYYRYMYDESGRLSGMEGQFNLRPYGQDSVSIIKSRVVYDEKKMTYSSYSLQNGEDKLIRTSEVDSDDRPIKIQNFDVDGKVSTELSFVYDEQGRLIRYERHFNDKTEYDEECSDLREQVLEFEYLPNGLLRYANVKTNKGSCGLMFSYK
jgi:hypothetical protein